MSTSTYRFKVTVPQTVEVDGLSMDRETFYAWAWDRFPTQGMAGVHEGTVLTEAAHGQGLETESWTLDAAEAPRERDWVGHQDVIDAELYFNTREGAEEARDILSKKSNLVMGQVEEQKAEDWIANWRASFTGAKVKPFWSVLPTWIEEDELARERLAGQVIVKINPGAGFGTGTHETTQLCLEAIGSLAPSRQFRAGTRVLDFGSGSGILAIGAALLGAQVDAVEIDPLAIDNALENAAMNGVDKKIRYSKSLESARGPYEVVIANILRPVLIEFAPALVQRMKPDATLILSGLIGTDVPEVVQKFSAELASAGHQAKVVITELGDWRSVVWQTTS